MAGTCSFLLVFISAPSSTELSWCYPICFCCLLSPDFCCFWPEIPSFAVLGSIIAVWGWCFCDIVCLSLNHLFWIRHFKTVHYLAFSNLPSLWLRGCVILSWRWRWGWFFSCLLLTFVAILWFWVDFMKVSSLLDRELCFRSCVSIGCRSRPGPWYFSIFRNWILLVLMVE